MNEKMRACFYFYSLLGLSKLVTLCLEVKNGPVVLCDLALLALLLAEDITHCILLLCVFCCLFVFFCFIFFFSFLT